MDAVHRLDTLRTEGASAARAADGRLATPVPNLDWTVGEVLRHLGGNHRWFAGSLNGEQHPAATPDETEVGDDDLVDWYRRSLAELVAVVGAVDLADRFPTWAGERDGHWILRRLANETIVHRWDIEAASGPPEPIPVTHAADLVDELVTELSAAGALAAADDLAAHDGLTLHLHATDVRDSSVAGGGEWLITTAQEGLRVEHRHAKGDVAVRGAMADIALWVNGRLPASRLETYGDHDHVDWWSRALTFD